MSRWAFAAVAMIVMSAGGATWAAAPVDIANTLDILPTPREMELTGDRSPVGGWSICVAEDAMLAQTGAEEINDRVTALGGEALAVTCEIGDGNVIVVAPCTDPLAADLADEVRVSPDDPGEQGYVIAPVRSDGRTILAAIGSDDLGTLYACMTLRRMIQPAAGGPELVGARVRDWPMIKRRCLGCLEILDRAPQEIADEQERMAAYAEEYEPYIRFLARNKINFVNSRGYWGGLDDPRLDAYRAASDFAARYGIRVHRVHGTAIGGYITDDEWTGCVTRGDARHCWTADEAHRQKARDEAELAKQLGIGYQVMHVVDSGGMFDPELWSQRCDRCRERYGDDHAKAVIDQVTLYYETLREALPDCIFEVVVQPYHFVWLEPDFLDRPLWYGRNMPGLHHLRQFERMENPAEMVQELREYHRRIAEGLPDDVVVCFREGGGDSFRALGDLWQGHPIDAWYYLYRTHGWDGLTDPQARFMKSWDRDEPSDVIFGHAMRPYHNFDLHETTLPSNAEYAWNADLPDAEPTFDISKRFLLNGAWPVPEFQRDSLIPRIARRAWGRSADPLIELMQANVSLPYIADTAEVAGREGERFDDPNRFIEQQTAALVQAREKLNALLDGLDEAPSGVYGDIREEFGYRSLLWTQYFVNLATAKGEVESACIQARRLAGQGEYDEALSAITVMRERLPGVAQMCASAGERFHGANVSGYIDAAVSAGQGKALAAYGVLAQDQRLADLSEEIARQREIGSFPEHIRPLITEREVLVAPTTAGIDVDGRASEDAWADAQPVEFFVTDEGRRLAHWPTRARLLWDEDALYLHAEMLEDEGVAPKNRAAGVWEIVRQDDWIEVRVAPEDGAPVRSFLLQAGGMPQLRMGDGEPQQWPEAVDSATVGAPGLWQAEMRLPFDALEMSAAQGATWQVNIIRHRAAKAESPGEEDASLAAGSNECVPATFVADPTPPQTTASFALEGVKRGDQTVEDGFATVLKLRPVIETNRQSRDVTIRVAVAAGNETLAEYERHLRQLPGLWRPAGEVQMNLGRAIEGDLQVTVAAVADDGSLDEAATFSVDPRGSVTGR